MNDLYHVEIGGERYGPADMAQLQEWAAQGRVAPATILVNARTGDRIVASQFPPLAGRLRVPGAAAPPSVYTPPPPTTALGGYTPPEYASSTGYSPPIGAYASPASMPARVLGAWRVAGNDSGSGAGAQLPTELRGLNVGALLNPLFWSIFNRTYIGLLCLIPYVGFIMPWILLAKGNEWAWQNRRFESVDEFRQVQRSWANWGVALVILYAAVYVIAVILKYHR